jgi:hypothetical protein
VTTDLGNSGSTPPPAQANAKKRARKEKQGTNVTSKTTRACPDWRGGLRILAVLAAGSIAAAGFFASTSSVTGVEAPRAGKNAEMARQINLLYTINNLGYIDTCG